MDRVLCTICHICIVCIVCIGYHVHRVYAGEGPEGFKYWTVGHYDKIYSNWGHDIVFQDGPTGVTWRWGNFNVSTQEESLFTLPGTDTQCATKCSKLLSAEEHSSLESHVRRYYPNLL